MPRVVKRRACQIIHGRIDDHERGIACAGLYADDPRQQYAGIARDNAAGFKHQADAPILGHARDHSAIIGWLWRIVTVTIAHAKATTQVHMGNFMPLTAQQLHKHADFRKGRLKRLQAGQLAANVQRQTAHMQVW